MEEVFYLQVLNYSNPYSIFIPTVGILINKYVQKQVYGIKELCESPHGLRKWATTVFRPKPIKQ